MTFPEGRPEIRRGKSAETAVNYRWSIPYLPTYLFWHTKTDSRSRRSRAGLGARGGIGGGSSIHTTESRQEAQLWERSAVAGMPDFWLWLWLWLLSLSLSPSLSLSLCSLPSVLLRVWPD